MQRVTHWTVKMMHVPSTEFAKAFGCSPDRMKALSRRGIIPDRFLDRTIRGKERQINYNNVEHLAVALELQSHGFAPGEIGAILLKDGLLNYSARPILLVWRDGASVSAASMELSEGSGVAIVGQLADKTSLVVVSLARIRAIRDAMSWRKTRHEPEPYPPEFSEYMERARKGKPVPAIFCSAVTPIAKKRKA